MTTPEAEEEAARLFGNDTKNILTFEDSRTHEGPSTKYGLKLSAPLFVGFIVLAFAIVALLMRCSRQQEAAKCAKKEGTYVFNPHFSLCYFTLCYFSNWSLISVWRIPRPWATLLQQRKPNGDAKPRK